MQILHEGPRQGGDLTMGRVSDYVRAARKGSREASLENSTGWVSVHKVHKSKRTYDRKKFKIEKEE